LEHHGNSYPRSPYEGNFCFPIANKRNYEKPSCGFNNKMETFTVLNVRSQEKTQVY